MFPPINTLGYYYYYYYYIIIFPGDSTLSSSKVLEKYTHYTDLKIEVDKLWTVKCFIVPIVVGVLGSNPLNLTKCLSTISLQASLVRAMQNTVLLSSAYLIRCYLNVNF